MLRDEAFSALGKKDRKDAETSGYSAEDRYSGRHKRRVRVLAEFVQAEVARASRDLWFACDERERTDGARPRRERHPDVSPGLHQIPQSRPRRRAQPAHG